MRLDDNFKHIRLGALAVAFALTATACAGSGAGNTVGADDTLDGAVAPTTAGSVATMSEPSTTAPPAPEPVSLFDSVEVPEFVNEGDSIAISAAAPMGGTNWLVVGMLDQPDERRLDPVAVEIDTANPELAVSVVLPFASSSVANVTDLVLKGDTPIATGYITEDGLSRPVLWEREGGEWTEISLDGEPGSLANTMGSDGTVVIGRVTIGGIDKPLLWQSGPNGWEQVAIAGRTDGKQSWIGSAVTTETGIVAVGGVYDPSTNKYSPSVWTQGSNGLEESLAASESLPEFGILRDILATESGIVIVGSSKEGGVSSPLTATTSDPQGVWSVSSPTVDTGDRQVTYGFGFRDLFVNEGVLWASMDHAFTQTISRSSDGGLTWTQLPQIFTNNQGQVDSNAFAVQNGVVLVGGDDLLMAGSRGEWNQVSSPALPRLQESKSAVDIDQTEDGRLLLGGNSERPDSDGFALSSITMWDSIDGESWEQQPLSESQGKRGISIVETPQGAMYFGFGTRSWKDRIAGWSETKFTSSWRFNPFDLTSTDTGRAISNDADSDGFTTSVVGYEINVLADGSALSTPIAHVIDADGNQALAPVTTTAPAGRNTRITCVVGLEGGGYFGLVEWAPRGYDIIASQDGSEWASVGSIEPFSDLDLNECGTAADGRWMITAIDSENRPYVVSSPDGLVWETSALPVDSSGSALELAQVDGITIAIGNSKATDNAPSQAAIWFESADGWRPIGNDLFTLGIEGDGYSRRTSIWSMVATDTQVLVVGQDKGRIGLWSADRNDFVAAIGG